MRNLPCIQGLEELEKLEKYAFNELEREEKGFVKEMRKRVDDYIQGKREEIFSFDEEIKLMVLWQKYQHLYPFEFRFNPEEKIPEVFCNRTAFVIWTTWRAFHLCGEEDLKAASLAAAEVLSGVKPPYPLETKEKAIEAFRKVMLHSGYREAMRQNLYKDFFEARIFPYLEGVWEFKWKVIK